MNHPVSRPLHPLWAAVLLAIAAGTPAAHGADTTTTAKRNAAKSEAQYQRDAAVCLSRRYVGDRDDCMSEAGTARSSREPVTVDTDPGRYARNAIKRCEPLPEPDRGDCVARMQGAGTTSGSVAGGGILRELVTREASPASAPAPAAPSK